MNFDSEGDPISYASLGAGVILFHENKVLLVQLNYGVAKGQWILPGGLVQPGEHPREAAERETLEETALSVRVTAQLSVRHRVTSPTEKRPETANVYWVFMGHLIGESQVNPASKIRFPESELQSVRFWDLAEAIAHPDVRPLTQFFIRKARDAGDLVHPRAEVEGFTRYDDDLFAPK